MLKTLLITLIITFFAHAQEKEGKEIVAKAGPVEITAEEFLYRYQLNPQLEIHRRAQGELNKKIFLYGIIAEKLLALEAAGMKLDTAETVRFYLKNFEKMFVRDELYRKEIIERSQEYASKLFSFYLENSSRIFTRNIIQNNETDINNIHSLLVEGVPFDSLFTEMTPRERDTITLYAGTLDTDTEQELFSLPEKSFSRPLQYDDHWVIFYIENKSDPVISRSMGWEAEYKRLKRAASEKAEAVFYRDYMAKFFPSRKADASGILIHSLAEKVTETFRVKSRQVTDDYYLTASDVVNILRNYPADTLNNIFIRLDPDPVTLYDFLMWLRTENYVLKENTYRNNVSLLNGKVKKYIEFELLAREGYRQGLDKNENVIKSTQMWKDNYLYQLRLSALSDSLLNGEYEYFKVAEIISTDLDVIEKVLNELASGADFMQLAIDYSIEEPDTSFRHISSFGSLKEQVSRVGLNEVFGPVSTDKGYVIFKVLDRKKGDQLVDKAAVTIKNPFNAYISSLARKYGISINDEVLASVPTTNINAMVFRYLGFGGRIAAVPVILPIAEWMTEYQKEIEPNP